MSQIEVNKGASDEAQLSHHLKSDRTGRLEFSDIEYDIFAFSGHYLLTEESYISM